MIDTSPNTTLYTLGKGVVEIAEWDGSVGAYVDVGNCPLMNAEVTEESLEHYSSRAGTKTKDKEVTLETGYSIEFDLDEISVKNLQIFLRGTLAGTGHKIHAAQALDKEYALKFTSANAAGPDEVWEFWKMKIKPRGSFNLIGDDWATLSFTGEGLSDVANHSTSPYFDVTYVTTTSTTTSTSTTTTTTTA